MASYYASITDEQGALIRAARLFFVATADARLRAGCCSIKSASGDRTSGVTLAVPNSRTIAASSGSNEQTMSVIGPPMAQCLAVSFPLPR